MGEQADQPAPVVVTLPAEIDMTNAEETSGELTTVFGSGASLVIADMAGTVFCDTAGLRALLRAQAAADARGVALRFVIPPDGLVRRALELTGFVRVLPVYASAAEAIGSR
jgi:anti-sigma B factor antagonist